MKVVLGFMKRICEQVDDILVRGFLSPKDGIRMGIGESLWRVRNFHS